MTIQEAIAAIYDLNVRIYEAAIANNRYLEQNHERVDAIRKEIEEVRAALTAELSISEPKDASGAENNEQ